MISRVVVLAILLVVLFSCAYTVDAKRKSKSSSSSSTTSSSSTASSSSSASSSKSGSGSDSSAGDERHKEICAKLVSTPVVSLTDGNFSKFITSRPRDYYAMVMFTALDAKYQCNICAMMQATFKDVAGYYQSQYNFANGPINERLAFFVVDVDRARNTFDDMQLQTVPRLYVLPPREVGASKLKMGDFEVDMRAAHDAGGGGLMTEIERLAKIKIVKTQNPRPLLLGLALVSVLIALLISAAATDLNNAWLWYQSRYLWVIVSVVCFSVGVSGSISCIIRSSPLYGYEGSRRGDPGVRIFAGQGREQYFVEGFIVAAWTVGCGLAGLMLYYSTKVPFALVRHVMAIAAMSAFIVLGLQIFEAYSEKTRWYQIKETIPPQFWSFLTSSVKKSSGLIKRLVRVSEIWLFDYKDWPGFQGKVKGLVVDYIKRKLGFPEVGK